MKRLRVTVNGQIYDVTVEELDDAGVEAPPPPAAKPATAPPAPAPAAVPPPAAPAAARPTGVNGAVCAPLVGRVSRILIQPGQDVDAGQPLVVLDAMKMDTPVNAPRAGRVSEVTCAVGDNVRTGQKLVVLA